MLQRRRYFAAGVIARRTKKGLEFLVLEAEYESGHREIKFPGGMEDKADSGNPHRTLREEIEEETGLRLKDGAEPRLIREVLKEDHQQFFFFLWRSNFRGSVRRVPIKDGLTVLHPPFWVNLETLRTRLYRTHRPVLDTLPLF
ncbi:MAG: NUDIX domain-containing protein [Candidatus Zambryskibacteria bacterium]|nr:NUDIX domain-containing protein [Candidatus Zambryskibacteria bacterium]